MRRVLRWEVPVNDQWHDIGWGKVVLVDARSFGTVEVWTEEHMAEATRPARVFGTGHPIESPNDDPTAVEHVGSCFDTQTKRLVWHVYAEKESE